VVCGRSAPEYQPMARPVRSCQNIPFRTRRSSTRGTPRGLFGSSGEITDH